MGRRGGGSRGGSSPFGRSRTTTSSSSSSGYKPAPTSQPKSNPSSNTNSSKPNQQTTQQAPTSGGGGLMNSFLGSAMGSMAGMYISNKLFSPSESPETMAAIDKEMGPCSQPFKSFLQCVESNPDNIGSCQWSYNLFSNCQSESH